jgi:hypothetical protein
MELMIWPREVYLKALPLKIKFFIMICCLFLCFFSVDTAQRYNHLIELIIKDGAFYTLEIMPVSRFQEQESIYLNIYKSRWRWMIGIACISERIEDIENNSTTFNYWSINNLNSQSITIVNQGKQVIVPLVQCN